MPKCRIMTAARSSHIRVRMPVHCVAPFGSFVTVWPAAKIANRFRGQIVGSAKQRLRNHSAASTDPSSKGENKVRKIIGATGFVALMFTAFPASAHSTAPYDYAYCLQGKNYGLP